MENCFVTAALSSPDAGGMFVRSYNGTGKRTRKVRWTAFLVLAGIGIGVVLPLSQVWSKFFLLILILPVLGLVDVLLLKSGRGLSFWIRACGFEVGTVSGAAAAARFFLDLAGAAALVPAVN